MSDPGQKLRIVHVDSETGFSGGEVQVFLLLEGLRAHGHDSLLISPPGSRCEREARARGFETRAVRMRNDLDARGVHGLWRAFRESGADLVHLHTGRATWLGGLAARLAGLPALTTRRMDRRVRPGLRTQLIYRVLTQRAVAISPAVARRLADAGVPAGRTRTIYSSVDPRAVEPRVGRSARRRAGQVPEDALLLLVLANLVRRKGVDVLLEALVRLDSAPRLWIAGDGPERGALEALSQRLGLAERVRFLGRCDDTGDLLAACDVFVMPSRLEGLGVAALEAMAAGRPVVASRVGGLAGLVVHGRTGLLVPPDDVPALTDALRRVLEDTSLRAALAAEGPRRIAEGWLAEQMVGAYEALYAELLSSGGRAAFEPDSSV